MKILRFVARLAGWLLTPLVAWAASFFGAWLGALLAGGVTDSGRGLLTMLGVGALFAIGATVAWMWFLRRSPELRESLGLTEEGVPLAAVDLADKAGEVVERAEEALMEKARGPE